MSGTGVATGCLICDQLSGERPGGRWYATTRSSVTELTICTSIWFRDGPKSSTTFPGVSSTNGTVARVSASMRFCRSLGGCGQSSRSVNTSGSALDPSRDSPSHPAPPRSNTRETQPGGWDCLGSGRHLMRGEFGHRCKDTDGPRSYFQWISGGSGRSHETPAVTWRKRSNRPEAGPSTGSGTGLPARPSYGAPAQIRTAASASGGRKVG